MGLDCGSDGDGKGRESRVSVNGRVLDKERRMEMTKFAQWQSYCERMEEDMKEELREEMREEMSGKNTIARCLGVLRVLKHGMQLFREFCDRF